MISCRLFSGERSDSSSCVCCRGAWGSEGLIGEHKAPHTSGGWGSHSASLNSKRPLCGVDVSSHCIYDVYDGAFIY